MTISNTWHAGKLQLAGIQNCVLRKPSWYILVTNQSMLIFHLTFFEDIVIETTSDTINCIERSQVYKLLSMTLIWRAISLRPILHDPKHILRGRIFHLRNLLLSFIILCITFHSLSILRCDLFCQQSSKKGEIVGAISAYLVFWRLLTETCMDWFLC